MALQNIQIFGGETFATAEADIIFKTVLGPCVSACLYDPVMKIGGMNHFLLATGGNRHTSGRDRFGDVAMETLLNDMISMGANPWRMQAMLFGGKKAILNNQDVGRENAAFATQFLKTHGIRLADSDLGGDSARWVTFQPSTGRVHVKRQSPTFQPANLQATSGERLRR
jgi:chemotaxis protein CheD